MAGTRKVTSFDGTIRCSRNGQQDRHDVLVISTGCCILISRRAQILIFEGTSLPALFQKLPHLTTGIIHKLLESFGLTMNDVFLNDPEGTTAFLNQICEQLADQCLVLNANVRTMVSHLHAWETSLPESPLRVVLNQCSNILNDLPEPSQ